MRAVVLLGAAVLLTGCNGGTVDRHALTKDASTISSLNCEGWLVARAVGRGRVTATYAGGQAEALRIEAANLADALSRRPAEAGLEERVRAAGKDAGTLAARLQQLRRAPTRAAALALAREFRQAGRCP